MAAIRKQGKAFVCFDSRKVRAMDEGSLGEKNWKGTEIDGRRRENLENTVATVFPFITRVT